MAGRLVLAMAAMAVWGLGAAHAQTGGQQMTQPSASQNQSQTETNQQQAPPQQKSTIRGQGNDQPSASQNQSQVQQNQSQQPPQAHEVPATKR